jgi:hypothetical protein
MAQRTSKSIAHACPCADARIGEKGEHACQDRHRNAARRPAGRAFSEVGGPDATEHGTRGTPKGTHAREALADPLLDQRFENENSANRAAT